MSAIKIYYNDSLWIVRWDHRPPGRFAPHDKICDILRAAIKSWISADMLSLRIWYSVIIHITYRLLHTCNFFQMLMKINRSNWGHLQKGALCPMLLYRWTDLPGEGEKINEMQLERSMRLDATLHNNIYPFDANLILLRSFAKLKNSTKAI